jgi:hypothetical protein
MNPRNGTQALAASAIIAFGIVCSAVTPPVPGKGSDDSIKVEFRDQIQPLLERYCLRCHNAETMESGIRLDQLTAAAEERDLPLLKGIHEQLVDGVMPPEDEPQPSVEERAVLDGWITRAVAVARSRDTLKNGSARRLTVSQYRNTLRDLLGLKEDLTERLPPDGVSKDGFANNGQTMVLSPLQVETYFEIAEGALNLCIVDEEGEPEIQSFRMELGAGISRNPCQDNLILGANSELLGNSDFVVTELQPAKTFAYEPFLMRTSHQFIEGYAGNDTVRGWKSFNSIYHCVFACVRGTPGYPKGDAHETVAEGLLLRPAIPSEEIFGQSNTYGPMANFKISLRQLPDHGDFRVTVRAARYDDALLLETGAAIVDRGDAASQSVLELAGASEGTLSIPDAGIYQVDVCYGPRTMPGRLSLALGGRQFSGQLPELKAGPDDQGGASTEGVAPFLLVRLPVGELKVIARAAESVSVQRLVFSRLGADSEKARRFDAFERRSPTLGVHVGLRRDCGSTLTQVGEPRTVSQREVEDFAFEGAINDFPSPDVEKDNVNYLAGLREIGVRHEFTDGRDIPRLLVKSVEFEGPYYTTWPPESHRSIFIDSPHPKESAAYAREIIGSFGARAFRRPITAAEEDAYVGVWQRSIGEGRNFRESIKDALVVVLTSPQFLFLIEESHGPEAEDLSPYELASKLSYFLWNTSPDGRLLELAAANSLRDSLDAEAMRLIHDPRFGQFADEFTSQWLGLDKFDVVATDLQRFPALTRDTKRHLREEPIHFVRHLIEENLPLRHLIESDFIVANDVVARYYGVADRVETGVTFIPVRHENKSLGGVLTQAAILAGLSDGRESNPVKRGAWLARKIIAEPPDDPPPNVPKLPDDDGSQLTLREKLERHRNQKGCVRCHTGIDPWGLPFETMSAGGLPKTDTTTDTGSTLPDGTVVADLNDLRTHLIQQRIDQVAFSFVKHVATYACGRSLSYNEVEFLREHVGELRSADYRMGDMIRFVIASDIFLKK